MPFSLPQELSSLSENTERFLAENWLLAMGTIPDSAAQTLMLYAYGTRGVKSVSLVLNQDEIANGRQPKLIYRVVLNPYFDLRFKKYAAAKKENGIWGRIRMLFWIWMGAPAGFDRSIVDQAKAYLPPNYDVSVEVV